MTTQATATGNNIKKESPDSPRQEQVRKPQLLFDQISSAKKLMFMLYILLTA